MSNIDPPIGTDPREPHLDGRGTNRGWGCTWWWWVVAILILLLVLLWAAFGPGRYDDDAAVDPAPNPLPLPAPTQTNPAPGSN
jgi:hypothetical protein